MAITSAKGTLVKIGDGASTEAFTTIGQVRSISGPSVTATVQDVTTHSTSGNWMEKLATLIDPGSVSFPINYDHSDAAHAFATGLWNDMVNLTLRNFEIEFPTAVGQTLSISAYIASHSFDAPVDNVLQATIELSITGAITAAVT